MIFVIIIRAWWEFILMSSQVFGNILHVSEDSVIIFDWNVAEFSSNVCALCHLKRVSMNRYSHRHCKTV